MKALHKKGLKKVVEILEVMEKQIQEDIDLLPDSQQDSEKAEAMWQDCDDLCTVQEELNDLIAP